MGSLKREGWARKEEDRRPIFVSEGQMEKQRSETEGEMEWFNGMPHSMK